MVHGLPGSGKSRLIKWLKEYFEEVWLWTQEKQYALVAPMNTMADNIGGTTIHSFARFAFSYKRGFMVQPGKKADGKGSIFTDEPWHELRIVLVDEVETCGTNIFGHLEESLQLNVLASNSACQALRKTMHPSRQRRLAA